MNAKLVLSSMYYVTVTLGLHDSNILLTIIRSLVYITEPSMPGPADYKVKHVNLKKSPQYTCRQRTKHTFPDSVTYAKCTYPLLMCRSRGGAGGPDPPLKKYKNVGFLSNTGPEPLKNPKATKRAIIGLPAKRHLNKANSGIWILLPSAKKRLSQLDHL